MSIACIARVFAAASRERVRGNGSGNWRSGHRSLDAKGELSLRSPMPTGCYTRVMSEATQFEVVSRDDEPLILVDGDDRELGTLDKASCHDGDGVLHRAFSLFVFNAEGDTLLQRRHSDKRLWPGFWSNACCSHPRRGEALLQAVVRRAEQELGLAVEPKFLFKFQYRATFADAGSEFELCSVFVSHGSPPPRVNATEIAEWRWVSPDDLEREIETAPAEFTPWLKIEWQRLRTEFSAHIRPR